MKGARFYDLVEGYLADTLGEEERRELEAMVVRDPEARRELAAQVRLARSLAVLMRRRVPEETWGRIERLLADEGTERGRRLADAVDALIGPEARRPARRWPWALGILGAAVAAAAVALFWAGRPAGEVPPVAIERRPARVVAAPPVPPPARAEPEPAPVAIASPEPEAPPAAPMAEAPPAPAAAPAAVVVSPALLGDRDDVVASEGATLASRPDLIFYGAFERRPSEAVWPIRFWGRQQTAVLGPGLVGQGLRVRYPRGSTHTDGGTRMRVRLAQLTDPPAGRDQVHLRYYVRLEPGFEFGRGGGLLPGLCGGRCDPPANGRDGFSVRMEWRPDGELGFHLVVPAANRPWTAARWKRPLVPGTWHAIELRVKLNRPGANDGTLEGWLDGVKASTVKNVRLRDVPGLQIDSVLFDTSFRRSEGLGAPRDSEATFDNVAVAGRYIGPRVEPEPEPPAAPVAAAPEPVPVVARGAGEPASGCALGGRATPGVPGLALALLAAAWGRRRRAR